MDDQLAIRMSFKSKYKQPTLESLSRLVQGQLDEDGCTMEEICINKTALRSCWTCRAGSGMQPTWRWTSERP